MATERLVVVGNGMAGARTVEEILAAGRSLAPALDGSAGRFEITLFGDEPYGNYNRILLSSVLSGDHEPGGIFLNPVTWYEENGITLHCGDRVTRIDREARLVISASGREVPYDRLILATGSRAFVPPMDGLRSEDSSLKPGVFVFRSLDDCRRIAGFAGKCRRAVVIGGGLLGLEAAYGLRGYGIDVQVVHQAGHLLNRQLDAIAAETLRSRIEQLGIGVLLNHRTVEVLGAETVTGLRFQGGETLECDMVVFACGIQPNVELAGECGLTVNAAIVVDDQLRTSDPAIYAVGECAQHRGQLYGLVAPLWEQAQVLAQHLTGLRPEATYQGSKTSSRLKVMGLEVASMGLIEPERESDEVVLFHEPKRGVYKKLIIRDDRLVGAIALGDPHRAPLLMQLFDRSTPLPQERASLLFDLGGAPAAVSPESMTDDAAVCHCNGVTKGDIRECIAGGGCSLQAVMRATRAGTGCGSCKGLVRVLVERLRPAGASETSAAAETSASADIPMGVLR